MTASAKGTLEEPGTNVRQKSGLNAAILDQGWRILFGLLDQKMEELGGGCSPYLRRTRVELVPSVRTYRL